MPPAWTEEQWDDVVDLLTYIAAADRRTIGNTDVRVWLDAARDGEWPSLDFAYRAVVKHRNDHPGRWLEPGHITQVWRRLREASASTFNPDLLAMPDDAADDPAAYKRWVASEAVKHREQLVTAFVRGDGAALLALEAAS